MLLIKEVSKGIIQPGTGMAEFVVTYRAIVLKPFKGEVVDGVVGVVNRVRNICLDVLCCVFDKEGGGARAENVVC